MLNYAVLLLITVFAATILKTFVVDAIFVPSPSMKETLLDGDFVLVNKLIYGAKLPQQLPFTRAKIPLIQLPALRSIERGDVIVFELPMASSEALYRKPVSFVKRCVALGGDKVSIRNGVLFVNDIASKTKIQEYYDDAHPLSDQYGPVTIPRRGDAISLTRENLSAWDDVIAREGHTVEQTASAILIDGQATTHYMIEKNYLFVLGDNRNHSYDSRYWGFLPEENVVGKAMMVYWSADPKSGVRWDRIGKLVE